MPEIFETVETPINQLLEFLPQKQLKQLLERIESVELPFGSVLHDKGEVIRDVYFPTSAVVSVFAVEDQTMLEVGMAGSEGIIGLSIASQVGASPYIALVQGAGAAFKMSASSFLKVFERNKLFARALNRYQHFFQVQISQNLLCTRLHLVKSRLACLLLLMQDRLKTNRFGLKQEFLSKMLGVRREAVTRAAGNLQQQEIICYSRGNLSILDRERLEEICCRCYKIVTEEYDRLLAVNK